MDYICTWIYLDSPEESSEYPQVGKQSHLPAFQKVYWKCVAVFFACSTKFNPDRRHVLFTNKRADEIPEVDGLDLKRFLTDRNVDIVTIPLTWQTPEGYFGKWRNQFYIFDILQFIENQRDAFPTVRRTSKSVAAEDSTDLEVRRTEGSEPGFVILDSDCIVNRPLDGLFAQIRQYGLLALPMPYSETHNINGVTREEMRRIYAELDGADPGNDPVYYGGEIFAATLPVIRKVNRIAPVLWTKMLERFDKGRPKLNEEAHFLSYCYHKIGGFGSLEGFIKRIWTSPKYSNVQPEDAQLPIWHLPSEKTGGIALLFKQLQGENWDWKSLGGYVGVPKRKRYLDLKHRIKHTLIYKWLTR
ncbi:MAG: hypothetical protein IPK76_06055 [Lewinellaceae bacterium]|nr:hypothetical protein [Lewinellaceae bacterium]